MKKHKHVKNSTGSEATNFTQFRYLILLYVNKMLELLVFGHLGYLGDFLNEVPVQIVLKITSLIQYFLLKFSCKSCLDFSS